MAVAESADKSVQEAIREAESLLPGVAADEGHPDPRWQAIIRVAEFLETQPEEVWAFACRWGIHQQADVRAAIATCILEHLLDFDFATFFPRVQSLARTNGNFAHTFKMCWKFGQAKLSEHAQVWDALLAELDGRRNEAPADGA
jgi:hypothetical protein